MSIGSKLLEITLIEIWFTHTDICGSYSQSKSKLHFWPRFLCQPCTRYLPVTWQGHTTFKWNFQWTLPRASTLSWNDFGPCWTTRLGRNKYQSETLQKMLLLVHKLKKGRPMSKLWMKLAPQPKEVIQKFKLYLVPDCRENIGGSFRKCVIKQSGEINLFALFGGQTVYKSIYTWPWR